ncbi:MAG: hypothetical protein JGK30_26025 [Microcoleus sp. PH2017_40_RAT_O_B]|uniref:hypothetical protein n=1 Tax=unclassified Microcoleus TaxID=2642155 RepID=UPI001DFB99D7|nr:MULTISPECIES: hypothetical protein [unclassified Microcoleus]MCC3575257.1 hypothetical protein [Microcoleus sp. PH2017_34_RAT_O_A]MCC3612834.1 hypothetical protein [Microcoleus sp. PH2017_40_RAT_O_B]
MFSLKVVLPVYKLNAWQNLQTSGEITATWTGDNLLEGDESIKKQATEWLEKQESQSRIISDYDNVLTLKRDAERLLRQVKRELKLNEAKLELLKGFFSNLGFEPDSEHLQIADNVLKQLQAVVVVEDDDDEEDISNSLSREF